MKHETFLWGVGWLVLGFSSMGLAARHAPMPQPVKGYVLAAMGIGVIFGVARIWGFV